MKFNGLEKEFKTENDEIVDFKQFNKNGWTPLMFALYSNKEQSLNLSEEQLDYLIKNSDLKQVSKYDENPLVFAFRFNKVEKLNLTSEQLDYLIKNSNLKQVNKIAKSPLLYALANNESENLDLSNEQWKYLIENSDLSLIIDKEQLMELKKMQSELLHDEILSKIDIKRNINQKNNKI